MVTQNSQEFNLLIICFILHDFLTHEFYRKFCALFEFALNFQAHYQLITKQIHAKVLAFVHSREQLDIVLSFKHFGV